MVSSGRTGDACVQLFFFFQAKGGRLVFCLSRGLGGVYKSQPSHGSMVARRVGPGVVEGTLGGPIASAQRSLAGGIGQDTSSQPVR